MAGSFFDGEGHHFTEYRSSETLSPLNFSITYQIRIKNDQIFKLRWFSYSRTINPLPENYVPPRGSESGPGYRNIDVGSFSYGKQHSWDFNPLHCLRSYYTFDFSYKLGTDALSSGMGSTNAHFSNPGIGMSFGSDIVLFARYTIGTELSYSHHFFQTGWQGNWHSGRPSADMFMQHFKIGYIFWSNRKW